MIEGDWQPKRLVVLEGADMAVLNAWYDSPEYAQIKALRHSASRGKMVAVEGL